MVPVPVSPDATPAGALDTDRLTVKVSSDSTTPSSVVDTVKVCVSWAVPAKSMPAVFRV